MWCVVVSVFVSCLVSVLCCVVMLIFVVVELLIISMCSGGLLLIELLCGLVVLGSCGVMWCM